VRTFIRSCFVSSGFLIVLFSGSYSGQKRNEVFAYIIAQWPINLNVDLTWLFTVRLLLYKVPTIFLLPLELL